MPPPEINARIADILAYAKTWLELNDDRRAVTAVEYALLVAVIVLVCVPAFMAFATILRSAMDNVAAALSAGG